MVVVRWRPLLLVAVLLVGMLSGCLRSNDAPDGTETASDLDPWADWRAGARLNLTSDWPVTLRPGSFAVAEPVSFALVRGSERFVPIGGDTSLHEVRLRVDIWYPVGVPRDQVPIVVQASPYHPGDLSRMVPGSEDAEFFLPTLVEKGIAYARYSVRGSGESEGCTDPLSREEQEDLHALIDFLGVHGLIGPLSNGNLGFIGASYPGVQAWAAAATGHPAVKTVVPIAAFPDLYGFHEWNGTWRTSAMIYPHNYYVQGGVLYGGPAERAPRLPQMLLCPDMAVSIAEAQATWTTGGPLGLEEDYWEVRDLRDRIVSDYEGSVFLIHGFPDPMVPIDNAYPFIDRLVEEGREVKMLLGQWGHATPWSPGLGDAQLRDQAEGLWRWFDRYLNENESQVVGPRVDVQSQNGTWRTETTWPPQDSETRYLYFGGDGAIGQEPQSTGSSFTVGMPGTYPDPGLFTWEFETKMDETLHVVGTPHLRATFVPTTPRVIIGAWLLAGDGDALRLVGHGRMDLRYADGTGPDEVLPGAPVTAHMQLSPVDGHVEEGERLVLRLAANTGIEPIPTAPQPTELRWGGPDSWLRLQTITR